MLKNPTPTTEAHLAQSHAERVPRKGKIPKPFRRGVRDWFSHGGTPRTDGNGGGQGIGDLNPEELDF